MDSFHPRQLDGMEREVLRKWLRDLLHGHHPITTPVDEHLPAELIAGMFFSLRGETRALVQRVLVGFLDDLAHRPGSEWHSEAGQELLRALPRVVYDDQRERAWDLLWEIATGPDRFTQGVNCHLPALQALLDLRYRAPFVDFRLDADFWRVQRVFEPYRSQYLTTILEGIVRAAPGEAMSWLAKQPYDKDLASAVSYLLPTLVRLVDFQSAFETSRGTLDPRLAEMIEGFYVRATNQGVKEAVVRQIDEINHAVRAFHDAGMLEHDWLARARETRLRERVTAAFSRMDEVGHG